MHIQSELTTEQHILIAARDLLLTQGIKKVSMDDIAVAAGLTRVTVYRYYGSKKDLVAAAFADVARGIQQARHAVEAEGHLDIDTVLDLIGDSLASLPPCPFSERLDELRRAYPDIYQSFHEARHAALEVIFNGLFAQAEHEDRLHPNLNRELVQLYFMESVVTMLESPRLTALNLSAAEMFEAVKSLFLYGILKEG